MTNTLPHPGRAAVGLAALALALAPAEARAQNERYTAFRVGADLGYARIANENFLQLNATGLVRLGPVRMDFNVPLRFRLSDFEFREADYADARDALRVIRCVRIDVGDYERPDDQYDPSCEAHPSDRGLHERVYFSGRLAPLRSQDFAHETLLTGFNNSLDPTARRSARCSTGSSATGGTSTPSRTTSRTRRSSASPRRCARCRSPRAELGRDPRRPRGRRHGGERRAGPAPGAERLRYRCDAEGNLARAPLFPRR
ncbi:MAG: hypothetical protein R3A48_00365 [Polyangiales bacterium]